MFQIKQLLFLTVLTCGTVENIDRNSKDWYETTVIYQIYTRSFKDSNGDGMGDIKGIQEKLDYIKNIGVETLWIQSFFKSPMRDFGYDVADYKQIEPMFGTIDEVKQLIDATHDRGMKVIIDFIPNHTSNESEWFIKSVNREEPYTDYYVWRDPKGLDQETKRPIPPNNWVSIFGGSAWVWNEKRRQFYYRIFSPAQPDLNYRNPNVRAAMEDVLRFWLDLGVDGFRVDAIDVLFEDKLFRDDPWVPPHWRNLDVLFNDALLRDKLSVAQDLEKSTNRLQALFQYQIFLEEVYEVTHEWRLVLDEFKAKDNKTRILVLESFAWGDKLRRHFGNETYKGSHLSFYFVPVFLTFVNNATIMDMIVHKFNDIINPYGGPSWEASNHDNARLPSRTDPEFSQAMLMTQLLLPGSTKIYYGEEIRMKNALVRPDQKKDRTYDSSKSRPQFTRDGCRAPMQWDNSINSGFTTNKESWLPLSAEYYKNNVKQQLEDPHSHLSTFKRLIQLRKSPVIQDGELETCVVSEWVYMFVRKLNDEPPIAVIINMGSETEAICLDKCKNSSLPDVMEVHTSSSNSGFNIGDKVTISGVDVSLCSSLRPKAGVVLTTVGNSPANRGTSLVCSCLLLMISLFNVAFSQTIFGASF